MCGLVIIAILTGKIATVLTDFGYAGPYISLYGTEVSMVKKKRLIGSSFHSMERDFQIYNFYKVCLYTSKSTLVPEVYVTGAFSLWKK